MLKKQICKESVKKIRWLLLILKTIWMKHNSTFYFQVHPLLPCLKKCDTLSSCSWLEVWHDEQRGCSRHTTSLVYWTSLYSGLLAAASVQNDRCNFLNHSYFKHAAVGGWGCKGPLASGPRQCSWDPPHDYLREWILIISLQDKSLMESVEGEDIWKEDDSW